MAVGLELGAEAFALLVDEVGDVISLPADQELPLPPHVSDARVALTRAVYRLPGSVLPVLDIAALVALPTPAAGITPAGTGLRSAA